MSEFWSNLISNAGGALVGTLFAFLLGVYTEKTKEKKRNKQIIREYKISILKLANSIKNLSFKDTYNSRKLDMVSVYAQIDSLYHQLIDEDNKLYVAIYSSTSDICPNIAEDIRKKLNNLTGEYIKNFQPEMQQNISSWTNDGLSLDSGKNPGTVKNSLNKKIKEYVSSLKKLD